MANSSLELLREKLFQAEHDLRLAAVKMAEAKRLKANSQQANEAVDLFIMAGYAYDQASRWFADADNFLNPPP